ncbi:MAG: ABC transporter ATP-binding protein [candidate division KSB1 bacterium]|nr:ABC transporter ATP-binding protein [candidate division KSB1 bacterium]MDZ7274525.1 ABC transporter ATP-binding protein [candidate division KSB1 bacterium]MDZ7284814.1 ABC transporter ATP-binding protein [candidate division KSB1 bacterium]MDZ7297766.1 ABC transporter ATP-binding protein [candidate division KSB1 bacterium]MDZ7306445.1 ABC transporter ATP-binding protein [candidate division KSB1 bacterium]
MVLLSPRQNPGQSNAPLLQLSGLQTHYVLAGKTLPAVNGVDLCLHPGETLALVGESGCGKTTLAWSIFRLLPPPGRIVAGKIILRGRDLLTLSEREMTAVRGREMGLVFQDPASALNPVMRVGEQVAEVIRRHFRETARRSKQQALALLERVQLSNVERLYNSFPHQLSGGQRQRVLIAIALAGRPSLLVADEPTSALDVSVQSQILALLRQLKAELQLALLLITHDLGVVAEMADRVAVMYAGQIVEEAPATALFATPLHPYTAALLAAMPRLPRPAGSDQQDLRPLHGTVPDLTALPVGCTFHPRCPLQQEICREQVPPAITAAATRLVRCLRYATDDAPVSQ